MLRTTRHQIGIVSETLWLFLESEKLKPSFIPNLKIAFANSLEQRPPSAGKPL